MNIDAVWMAIFRANTNGEYSKVAMQNRPLTKNCYHSIKVFNFIEVKRFNSNSIDWFNDKRFIWPCFSLGWRPWSLLQKRFEHVRQQHCRFFRLNLSFAHGIGSMFFLSKQFLLFDLPNYSLLSRMQTKSMIYV